MTFELEIIKWLQQFMNGFWNGFFTFWTLFGEEEIIIGIMGFVYWCYNKKAGEYLGISVFISLVLNSFIKILVARPRPFVVDPEGITNIRPETSGGYAFPSGHTQGATSVFGSVAVWMKNRWITIIATVIVVMVAISRMYIGVHYLSDVVVGALLGIGIAFVVKHFFDKSEDHTKFYNIIMIFIALLTIVLYLVKILTVTATATLTDAESLYENIEGILKMSGAFMGFAIGVQFEAKKIGFTNNKVIWKNILRFVLGVAVVMVIRLGAKAIFTLIINPENLLTGQFFQATLAGLFDFIRYFAMVFVGIGIYPLVFKKLKI